MVNSTAIESALGKLRDFPTPVSSWQVEAGPDATDDPAVWVWVMLEHEEVDAGTRSQLRNIVRDLVHRETDAACWVYVRFRGASETIDYGHRPSHTLPNDSKGADSGYNRMAH